MIHFKIHGGTAPIGHNLCTTCKRGQIVKFVTGERVHCRSMDKMVPAPVVECNEYYEKTMPWLHEMEEIAWRLVTKKAGREVGFVNATEYYRQKAKEEESND